MKTFKAVVAFISTVKATRENYRDWAFLETMKPELLEAAFQVLEAEKDLAFLPAETLNNLAQEDSTKIDPCSFQPITADDDIWFPRRSFKRYESFTVKSNQTALIRLPLDLLAIQRFNPTSLSGNPPFFKEGKGSVYNIDISATCFYVIYPVTEYSEALFPTTFLADVSFFKTEEAKAIPGYNTFPNSSNFLFELDPNSIGDSWTFYPKAGMTPKRNLGTTAVNRIFKNAEPVSIEKFFEIEDAFSMVTSVIGRLTGDDLCFHSYGSEYYFAHCHGLSIENSAKTFTSAEAGPVPDTVDASFQDIRNH